MFSPIGGQDAASARLNDRYHRLIEHLDSGVLQLDQELDCRVANPAAAALLGYTQRECCELSLTSVIASSELNRVVHQLATQRAGEAVEDNWRFRRKDRSSFDAAVVTLRDAEGNIRIIIRAVAACAQMKEALQLTSERFQTALKSSPVTLFNQDRDLRYTWIYNPVAGYRPEDLLGRSDAELLGSVERAACADALKRNAMLSGETQRGTVKLATDRGDFIFDLTADPRHNLAGEIIGVTCAAVDITEREAVKQSLRESEEKHRQLSARLAAADEQKDAFLAMLAHELRNPLSAILSALQVQRMADTSEKQKCCSQNVIERQTEHLRRLTDDLLDIGRIKQNKVELRKERLFLADVIRGAGELSQRVVGLYLHRLDVSLPDAPVMLEGDPVRLVQVLNNLIDNAAKYTPSGGHIHVEARCDGQDVVIIVTDTGVGIPLEEQSRLFERFYQVDQNLRRAGTGLGLGLSLVRQFVELHGGTVEVFSPGTNRGCRFTVRLPRIPEAEGNGALSTGSSPLPETLAGPAAAPGRKRILVADDHPDSLEAMQMLLELLGHEVHVARDGMQALESVERLRPDVALLDLCMPVLDGLEAARQIRRSEWGQRMLLLAQTGWARQEDIRRSQQAGFDAHLLKPINPQALIELLGRERP